MFSFMTSVDQLLNNAVRGINFNQDEIVRLASNMQETVLTFGQAWSSFAQELLKHTHISLQVDRRTEELIIGVKDLIRG